MAQLLNNLLASLSPSDGIEVNDPVFLRFQEFAMRAESTETSGRAVAWFCGVSEPKCSDAGEYCRDELILEAVGEAMRYASQRGMQGWEVRQFLRLFCTFMESMCAKGDTIGECTLGETTHLFAASIHSLARQLPPSSAVHATRYTAHTLLHHFHLYSYLLNNTQEEDITRVALPVDTPQVLLPLRDSIPAREWERREEIRKVGERYTKKQKEEEDNRESQLSGEKTKKQEVLELAETTFSQGSEGMREEEVGKVIDSVAAVHRESLLSSLTHHMRLQEVRVGECVERVEVDLHAHTEQCLPVPSAPHSPAGAASHSSPSTRAR